jgi:rsbT co-antagonist protein RsbR
VFQAMMAAIAEVAGGNLRARVDVPEGAPATLVAFADGVNQLILAWRTAELTARRTKRALEEKIAMVEGQAVAIRELSSPILQVWRGVLLLPLVGGFDDSRSTETTETLLSAIADTGAQQVIIDVTGVDQVDEQTAGNLLRLVHAASLVGARCMVTGIGAAVALTFVSMGASLGGLETFRTLELGLRACLDQPDTNVARGPNRTR